ncbi:hypothetical protein BOTNAR_0074g00250 [Botryotinia narcissicola]|uniref:Uncharacterized protein n=1 Tax=Botryotinia narcissicola TaxID=278944 RepID=A0A4Z1J2N0_9HELO|nr:hypothetical protein BOTNAR_0074g00250 [Botryotinia narcissicola]
MPAVIILLGLTTQIEKRSTFTFSRIFRVMQDYVQRTAQPVWTLTHRRRPSQAKATQISIRRFSVM